MLGEITIRTNFVRESNWLIDMFSNFLLNLIDGKLPAPQQHNASVNLC